MSRSSPEAPPENDIPDSNGGGKVPEIRSFYTCPSMHRQCRRKILSLKSTNSLNLFISTNGLDLHAVLSVHDGKLDSGRC